VRGAWETRRPPIGGDERFGFRESELGPPGPAGDRVRLSLRIVIHLAQVGPLASDEVAKAGSAQAGIAESLATTQGAVSKILARLVAAGVIRRERRHVRGQSRRVRVYFLTQRGEALAAEIREKLGLEHRPREA
jgi:DNA-binding MarR family transcriptional regulator